MASSHAAQRRASENVRELDDAHARRAREDLELTMSERLAKLHTLCAQFTAIAGAARKQ